MRLALFDTAGIQAYVFASNRLRENVGASHLVRQATEAWALAAVRATFPKHNVGPGGALDTARHIERDELDAEVVYAGGGNVLLLCKDADELRAFTRRLSTHALTHAPGLRLVAADVEASFDRPLPEAVRGVFHALFEAKRALAPSAPLLGLGVTVACRSTGLPAADYTQGVKGDPLSVYPASAEVLGKLDASFAADRRLRRDLKPPGDRFAYPTDFDELGRTEGRASYVAVVHADGNGMGERIRTLKKKFEQAEGSVAEKNRAYLEALRAFSGAVEAAARAAQQAVINRLAASVDETGALVHHVEVPVPGGGTRLEERIRIQLTRAKDHPRWLLPIRPLVFGGDDLTFVCDGRLGVTLALDYLRAFEAETEKRAACGGRLTASAGVALVKTHYPFARAYALAEELAASAKRLRRAAREKEETWEAACLDWHLAHTGLSGTVEQIRRREFRAHPHPTGGPRPVLTLRPVALDAVPPAVPEPATEPAVRTWATVESALLAFQGPAWSARRNKAKRLREALREGTDATTDFTLAHDPLPAIPDPGHDVPEIQKTGYLGNRCVYFDALELADLFIPRVNDHYGRR